MKKYLLFSFMLISLCLPVFSQEAEHKYTEQLLTTISPECAIAAYMFKDLNNDKLDEFLVISREGHVRTWTYNQTNNEFEEVINNFTLPSPRKSLLSLSSFFKDGQTKYFITLTPDGLFAYPLKQNGGIESEGILINRRMKFQFRMDQPVFSEFLQDINQDGKLDVIVPIVNYCEIWINEGFEEDDSSNENKIPSFSKIGKFPIEMVHTRQTDLQNPIANLSEVFTIPNLLLKDINGDKCLDLVVSHNPNYDYYILDKNGEIPEKPTVSLDLNLYQDTTPKIEGFQLGQTLSINEPQLVETDLNNDNIPDYIISHMRKFWIFHGTTKGPQFTDPSSIIKIAEDVTLILPFYLDEDDYRDLLMLKIQLPTLSTLLRGLFADWKFIKLESIGYKSIQGESFELSSTWKGELFWELPPILSIMKNPDMFDDLEIEQKYSIPISGDFDGDSIIDIAMTKKSNGQLQIWFGENSEDNTAKLEYDPEKIIASKIRKLLFAENNTWDFERIINSLNALINEQVNIVTKGEEPDFCITQPEDKPGLEAISVDFNHDKRKELLCISSDSKPGNYKKFELYTITSQQK